MLDNSARYLTVERFLTGTGRPGIAARSQLMLLAAISLAALPLYLYVCKRGANRSGAEQGIKGELEMRGLPAAKPGEARNRIALSMLAAVPLMLPPLMAVAGIWTRGGASESRIG